MSTLVALRVVLSEMECRRAIGLAVDRELNARLHGMHHVAGFDTAPWGNHIEAACAECAVAKLVHWYWPSNGGLPDRATGDVGGWQVRWSTTEKLILRPRDADEDVFIFVTGAAPVFYVRGSLLARAGKRPEWWGQPRANMHPCWAVPVEHLDAFDPELWAPRKRGGA